MKKRIENTMSERGYTFLATNPSNTWFDFILKDYLNSPPVHCELWVKGVEIEFEFTFVTSILWFYTKSGKLGGFFNEEHFKKFNDKFINFSKHLESLKLDQF